MNPIKRVLGLLAVCCLILLIAKAMTFSYRSNVFGSDNGYGGQYKSITLSDVSVYDPYVFRKEFIPTPSKRGLLIELPAIETMPVIEMVIGAGVYDLSFYKGGELVAETQIDNLHTDPALPLPVNADRAVVAVPEVACAEGYDTIAVVPRAGKSFFVAYMGLLESLDRVSVNNEIPPFVQTAYAFRPDYNPDASQHDITGVVGYLEGEFDSRIRLQIQSVSEIDVEVLAVVTEKGREIAVFPEDTIVETVRTSSVSLTECEATLVSNRAYEKNNLYLKYRYIDSDKTKTSKINPFLPYSDEVHFGTEIRTEDNLALFDFIEERGAAVRFVGNDITLDRMMFIPADKQLVLQAGQTIDLKNGASIVCRSALTVNGTEDDPVRLVSTDGTGQGLLVTGGQYKSKIDYLICDNLGEVHSGVYALTGAVTFYESDADFYGCRFLNNRSEDGLNIVRSEFSIIDCVFSNTAEDAFDSDFCTGLFRDCYFELTGNDALDVSTSVISVEDCIFRNLSDKAVSVGEASTATLARLDIENVQIGIGVKDNSDVTGRDITVRNAFIGYSAYQKKPEFSASRAELYNFRLIGNIDFEYLIEKDEILFVDGKREYPRSKKKEALIIERLINEVPIQ